MPSGGTLFPDPLETTTLAFRVAREAADAVPIVKQILGAAVHISEFAEKVKKKRESVNELVEKVNIYAAQIGAMVADRAASQQMDEQIQHRLQRLYAVFVKVETLISSHASTANPILRWFRNNVVGPNSAEKLSRKLQREVELFQIMNAVDIRFALNHVTRNVASDALYDGEFRRLRHCDVHKLATIAETREAGVTVTWARAEVDGKLMVVRYGTPTSSTGGDSIPVIGAFSLRSTYIEVIKSISDVQGSHPNIVQLYGINHRSSLTFTVFRSGSIPFQEYRDSLHNQGLDSGDIASRHLFLIYKLLDAARYLMHTHRLIWCPWPGGHYFFVDDAGEPTIGLLDDIQTWEGDDSQHWRAFTVTSWLMCPPVYRHDVLEEACNGGLSHLAGKMHKSNELMQVWERVRKERLTISHRRWPFAYFNSRVSLSESIIGRAQHYFDELYNKLVQTDLDPETHYPMAASWIHRQPSRRYLSQSVLACTLHRSYRLVSCADCSLEEPRSEYTHSQRMNALRFWESDGIECQYFSVHIPLDSDIARDLRRILGMPESAADTRVVYRHSVEEVV